MNANVIQRLEVPYHHTDHPARHTHHPLHFRSHAMSRRQFVRTALGTFAVGAAWGSGMCKTAFALASRSGTPLPIPGGTPALGGGYHVFAPGSVGFDPVDAEPITITDFNGFIGLGYLSGTVTQTNTSTSEVLTLPFVESDMRFMKGVYRGTDGGIHQGAFALV